ncbi:MAG: ROK family protein, partial [Clostridium sp.]
DKLAKEIIERFKDYLSIGIAGVVNTLDPDIIAIGGGLSKSSDIILKDLKEMIRHHILYKKEKFADIVVATLGNDAGIIGAAFLS